MASGPYPPKSIVRVTPSYPDETFHGRLGVLAGYSDDDEPRAIVVFVGADGTMEDTRFLFENELEAAPECAHAKVAQHG